MTRQLARKRHRTPEEDVALSLIDAVAAKAVAALGPSWAINAFYSSAGRHAGKIEGPICPDDPARAAAEALFSGARS